MALKNKAVLVKNTLDPIVQRWKFIAIIFLLCFLFYGNTLNNGYSMDDELVTYNHPVVQKGISAIPQIFTERYTTNSKQSYEYRPVVLVSFAIEHQLFGQRPAISHFINILLYAILCTVIFYTLLKLFAPYHWQLAALSTFIFLIHPLHTEVVASLKNRDEILALLFAFFALRNTLNYVNLCKIKYLIVACLFMLLSVLSKKSTITFAALIPLCLYYFTQAKIKHILFTTFLLVIAVWGIQYGLKYFLLSKSLGVKRNLLFFENPLFELGYSFIDRIPVGFYTLLFYLKMFFWPYPLVVYYGYNTIPIAGWSNVYAIIGMILFTGITIFAIYRIRKKEITTFAWLFFVIAISMFTNIVVPTVGIVAERFMFVGSIGLSVLCAYGIFTLLKINVRNHQKYQKNKYLNYITALLVIVNFIYIFDRNKDWNSHYSIYYADIQKEPEAAKLHSLLGSQHFNKLIELKKKPNVNTLLFRQHLDSSIFHFKRAIEIYPGYATCYNNLGTTYFNFLSDVDKAAYYFQYAINLDTAYVEAMYNLAMIKEIEFDMLKDLVSMFGIIDTTVSDVDHQASLQTDVYNLISPAFKKYVKFKQNLYYTANNIIAASRPDKPANAQSYYQQTFLSEKNAEIISRLNSKEIEKITEILSKLIIADIQKLDYSKSRLNIDSSMNTYFKPYFISYITENNKNIKHVDSLMQLIAVKALTEKNKKSDEIIRLYNKILYTDPLYSAAYDKLNVTYFSNNMFDSMISLNLRMLQYPQYRKDILYTQIGNGYNNLKNDTLTTKYYTMAAEEKEKLYLKSTYIYNHFLKAQNTLVCNKLRPQLNQIKNDIYITYVTVGNIYNTIGLVEKSQQALIKANNYNIAK